MKKMQTSNFIDNLTVTEKIFGVLGFLSSFFFLRFFKHNDDFRDRIRKNTEDILLLKESHKRQESNQETMQNTLEHLMISFQETEKRLEKDIASIKESDLICVSKKDGSRMPINEKVSQIAHALNNQDVVFSQSLRDIFDAIDKLNNKDK